MHSQSSRYNQTTQYPSYPGQPYPSQSYPPPYNPYATPQPAYRPNTMNHVHAFPSADFPPKKNSDANQRVLCAIVGVVLAAIAGVAAYYSLVNGLQMLDVAHSNLQMFTSGFLIYMGITFSFVSVGNFLYSGCKVVFNKRRFDYTKDEAITQIAVSIFAPVAVIPFALCSALEMIRRNR